MSFTTIRRTGAALAISAALALGTNVVTGQHASAGTTSAPCRVIEAGQTIKPDSHYRERAYYNGSRMWEVDSVRCLLNLNGYPVASNGPFDARMERSVSAFNRAHGLGSSSVVTPATWAELTKPYGSDLRGLRVAQFADAGWYLPTDDGTGVPLVTTSFRKTLGVTLAGTTPQQVAANGTPVSRSAVKDGDLVVIRPQAGDPLWTTPQGTVPAVVGIVYASAGYAIIPTWHPYEPGSLEYEYGAPGYWLGTRVSLNHSVMTTATFHRVLN